MITLITLLDVIFREHPKRKGMGKRGITVLLKCLASVTAAENANDRTLVLVSLKKLSIFDLSDHQINEEI